MKLRILHVFDDSESRTRGLQGMVIDQRSCALFVYESAAPRSFWMKDVPMDLFLSNVVEGECVESEFMGALSTKPHKLSQPTFLAVESRVEIPVGSTVAIEDGFLVF